MSSVEKKKKNPKDKKEHSDSKMSNTKPKMKDNGEGKSKREVDILDDAAMENAYNICHNVQDLLRFRGFAWEGQSQKKKGRKKGKKR